MDIEAVVLTGGKSSRMGLDKARLVFEGEELASRTARLLREVTSRVTLLGHVAVAGHDSMVDKSPYGGPLVALRDFQPRSTAVFVCACDIPRFEPQIVGVLAKKLTAHEPDMAVVPMVGGRLQPLCALYRANAFSMIATVCAEGRKSMMAWLDTLWVETIDEAEIAANGIDPRSVQSADTPEKFRDLTGSK